MLEIRQKTVFTVYSQRFNGEIVIVHVTDDPLEPYDIEKWNTTLRINALEQLGLKGFYQVDVDILYVGPDLEEAGRVLNASAVLRPRWSLFPFDVNHYQASRPHVLCVDTGAVYKNTSHAAKDTGLAYSQLHNHLALSPSYRRVGGLRFVRTAAPMTMLAPATKGRAGAALMTDEQRAEALAMQNKLDAFKAR